MTRHQGRNHWINVVAVAALCVAGRASAGNIIGPLANFDVVNDTGQPAYGFEIEIDDPSFDHTKLTSIFGYDRVFSFISPDPGAVVRFGKPVITDLPGVGVKITFGGTIGSVFTPSGTFNTPGESCWPGANSNWQADPCDHYGVSTLGQPASTTYRWLIESTPGSGTLVGHQVGIPSVAFVYTPPAPPPVPGDPPVPAAVNIQVHAVAPNPEQPENVDLWGEAFWVKTLSTKVDHDIDLGDLLRGDPDQEAAEVETEWSLFQMPPAGHVDPDPKELMEKDLELGDADHSVIRRYEFYKYAGALNPEDGEAICDGPDVPGHRCDTPFGDPGLGINDLGNYVGEQMAGVNFDVVIECSDGLDNDDDGYIDSPSDPGCASANDLSEKAPVVSGRLECDDGIDNDGDGLVDMADAGCSAPYASPENPPCNDNLDNDGDGFIDLADAECSTNWPYHEEGMRCGFGAELVLPLGFLIWLRNRGDKHRRIGRRA